MPLHRITTFTDLAIEVADCLASGCKQKIHRATITAPLGAAAEIRLDCLLASFQRNADGSYGAAIPFDIMPERLVALVARMIVAVGPDKSTPLFELAHDVGMNGGLVKNRQTGEEYVIPTGQSWLEWLDARPEDVWLQHEVMSEKRDTEEVCMRAFALWQFAAADAHPSLFA